MNGNIDAMKLTLFLLAQYAIVQTKADPGYIKYRGVGANMSVYNPPVVRSQYSLGHITIEAGPESIQVGWMVS